MKWLVLTLALSALQMPLCFSQQTEITSVDNRQFLSQKTLREEGFWPRFTGVSLSQWQVEVGHRGMGE